MTTVQRFYRLRIRDVANTADALVLTSVRGGLNPYIADEPSGDGQTLDPLTGTTDSGAYTVLAADPVVGTRVITSVLGDADFRYAILDRRAYVEVSPDGVTWGQLAAGFVTGCTLVDAITYRFTIGDAKRVELTSDVWAELTAGVWDNGTPIIGGPTLNASWGGVATYRGPWRMVVSHKTATIVSLDFRRGFVVTATGSVVAQNDHGNYETNNVVNSLAGPFWRPTNSATYAAAFSQGYFPGLVARVWPVNSTTPLGDYTPIDTTLVDPRVEREAGNLFDGGKVRLAWSVNQPLVNTLVDLTVFAVAVTERLPLHIEDHPVAIASAIYTNIGQSVNAASVTSVRAAIGDKTRYLRRVTGPVRASDALANLYGAFGFSARMNVVGERVFYLTRVRPDSSPVGTITINDLRDDAAPIFDLKVDKAVNRFTLKERSYRPGSPGSDATSVAGDGVTDSPDETTITDPTAPVAANRRPVTIDAGGDIRPAGFMIPAKVLQLLGVSDPYPFASAIARETFDRIGRGGPFGELHCHSNVTAEVGEEWTLDLAFQPNAGTFPATRGGLRIVQVLQRTEVPDGVNLRVLDSGSSTQLAVVPTFTVTALPDDPKRVAVVTITNVAALVAQGSTVRLEAASGTAPGVGVPGTAVASFDPAVTTAFTLPRADSGSTVSVRARSERQGRRPSAWSAWTGPTLTTLTAPSVLTLTQVDARTVQLAWTNADTVSLVRITERRTLTETVARVIQDLPAGSTRYLATVEPGVATEFGVQVRDTPPLSGASAFVTATITTTGSAPVLPAPSDPRAFAGSTTLGSSWFGKKSGSTAKLATLDGTYGMAVTATVNPSSVEFEVAVETGVTSGIVGTYNTAAVISSVVGGVTRFEANAPNDGRLRYMRARHTAPYAAPSAYTTVVPVNPWSALQPIGLGVTVPTLTLTVGESRTGTASLIVLRASFTKPTPPHYSHMEYSVRSRKPGGTYSTPRIVTGSSAGPDEIGAEYQLEFEVTPVTVTLSDAPGTTDAGAIRTSGTPQTVAVGDDPQANPTYGTIIRTATYVELPVTLDEETQRIEFWSEEDPNPITGSAELKSPKPFRILTRGDGQTVMRFPLTAAANYRAITAVAYDRNLIRGTSPPFLAQGDATATPPAVPTNPLPVSKTAESVTNSVVVPAGIANIRIYRGGVAVGLVAAAASGTTQNITTSGLDPSTAYVWEYASVNAAGVESTTKTAAINVTTDPGTIPTPNLIRLTRTSTAIIEAEWTAAAGTPSGVGWVLRSGTASGSYTDPDTEPTTSTTTSNLVGPGTRYAVVVGSKAGWTSSAASNERST